eukprot:6697103-Pyramimonas_sp.AAC.1
MPPRREKTRAELERTVEMLRTEDKLLQPRTAAKNKTLKWVPKEVTKQMTTFRARLNRKDPPSVHIRRGRASQTKKT